MAVFSEKTAFIGSGLIGSGLAVNSMVAGYETWLQTRRQIDLAKSRVQDMLQFLAEEQVLTAAEAEAAWQRAHFTTSIAEACDSAVFVQESGPEQLNTKRDLYAAIESVCPPDTVICSSTTQLLPSDLQAGALHPERIMVGHPYNPSFLLPLIEVCAGRETTTLALNRALAFYSSIGKQPLVCQKEVPGYIINRASWALIDECKKCVIDGICSAEDVDKALMYGPGLRMAITGQLLSITLGIGEGGFRELAKKYNGGECDPDTAKVADSVDEWMKNRPKEQGNTVDEINRYLNRKILAILRIMQEQ